MNPALLALFIRSLREDSRLKFTYFSRAALVLLILLFVAATKAELGWTNAPGLQFFRIVVLIDLIFIGLAGVSYFASAISEEKEEMTLGLLRMTNLNPLSILLGKSTSRLCAAALLFAAQFPFTLLAITLGGISLRQIVAAYLTVGAFLVFVSTLGLLASVICRRTSTAGVLTGVSLLLFIAASPLAQWFGQVPIQLALLPEPNLWTESLDSFARLASTASPFTRIGEVLNPGRTPLHPAIASVQLASNLGMGLAFFLLAWLVFEEFCGEQKESAASRFGVARARGRWRLLSPRRTWRRALAWKEFYFTNGGKLWSSVKLVTYGVLLAGLFFSEWFRVQEAWPEFWRDFAPLALGFALMCVCAELAFVAGTIFRHEHQGQTLSSLAMLPQGLRRVAYQKLLGVAPALGAAGFYLLVSLLLFAVPFHPAGADIRDQQSIADVAMGWAFYISQCLFFLHLVAALSLHVKRGALPLAIGFEVLFFIFLAWFFGPSLNETIVGIALILLALGATAFLHFSIGRRLETLAGEG